MKKEKLGQKIRKLRNENGLTQSELAEKIDVSFQQIQKYENFYRKRNFENRLPDIFGIDSVGYR